MMRPISLLGLNALAAVHEAKAVPFAARAMARNATAGTLPPPANLNIPRCRVAGGSATRSARSLPARILALPR